MNFFNGFILNLIFFSFPYLLYFLLRIYLFNDPKKDNYYFIFTSSISLILMFLLGKIAFLEIAIFIFLPILFNYIRRNNRFCVLTLIPLIFINNYFLGISPYLLLFEYFIYFINCLWDRRKNINSASIINKYIIIRTFFLSFYLFYLNPNLSLNMGILYLSLAIFISYTLSFSYYYVINKNVSLQELEKIKKSVDNNTNIKNYLCVVTHEIKNSLSISKGYLEMIRINNGKNKEYLNIIKKEVNRSIEIIQDGLNFSKDNINYEILDINLLLEDVSDTLRDLFKKNKISYRVKYIDDDVYILGDYNKLKQVLINVLKNSVESREKDLKIEIDNAIVRDDVCISISDNGKGFDDLSFVEEEKSSKELGMGIGTVLSKNIISRHNGKMIYESVRNKGTTVNIFLPLLK